MSNTSEKNKKEWNSPSVTRLGSAAQIIAAPTLPGKGYGGSDGAYLNAQYVGES